MKAESFIGRPCKLGHTLRYKSNKKCIQCEHEAHERYRNRPEQAIEPAATAFCTRPRAEGLKEFHEERRVQ